MTRTEKYKELREWIRNMNLEIPKELEELLDYDFKPADEKELKEMSKKVDKVEC